MPLTTTCRLQVRLFDPVAEHAAWMAHLDARRQNPADVVAASWAEKMALAQRVIVGWEGILDEAGQPAPCTPENVRRLLEDGIDEVAISVLDLFYVMYLAERDRWRAEGNGSAASPAGNGGEAAV